MNNDLQKNRTYLSAAGKDWLLPLYDPLTSLFGLDAFHYRLFETTELLPSQKILDIGCGTGSLGKIIKRNMPTIAFTGIDPDPKALAIAIKKLGCYSNVQFDLGSCNDLPYADASFDHVVSTFVFHHLLSAEKIEMAKEIRRVLKSGCTFRSIDFDCPDRAGKSMNKSIPDLLLSAGFDFVDIQTDRHWLFGAVAIYSAN